MLRNFIRTFQHTLTLQQRRQAKPIIFGATNFHRNFFKKILEDAPFTTLLTAQHNNHDTIITTPPETETTDAGYIVPYPRENERYHAQSKIVEALKTRFRLSVSDIKRIMADETVGRIIQKRALIPALDLLALAGISKGNFLTYPWLITIERERLNQKLSLIQSIPSIRDINHFVPFLRLTLPKLRKIISGINREKDIVPTGNRIYYIAKLLKIDSEIIAKYIAKRLFVLEMPFDMFEQNLHHMVSYKVPPMNILKDLWAFRYTPRAVQLRLERAKRAKKDKLMPWMVRCPEPILQRSLKLSLDELAVLGDKTTAVEYVAARLNFDVEHTRGIMMKHPQVMTVRVTKIKEVLDYILDEEGFTRYDIAQVPRILCHSLETTKQRIEELKSFGCRPSSLIIVCKSKREYQKFVRQWLEQQTKLNAAREAAEMAQGD